MRTRQKSVSSESRQQWHLLTREAVAESLQTDLHLGLTQAVAGIRLAENGPNLLECRSARSPWAILVAQLASLVVVLLLFAMFTALFLGEHLDSVAILIVILLNTSIGFFTEYKAQKALSSLERQNIGHAQIVRDGREFDISVAELVVGDLVVLSSGCRVPADGRIVESVHLQVEESALTGESQVVSKTTTCLEHGDTTLADRINMAFLGTSITSGRGRMLVTAVGTETEVGKVGKLIGDTYSRVSPLERKLTSLGQLLVIIVVVLTAIIVIVGTSLDRADFWHMLKIGLSLAIAAVPEGLPAVTTMTLAIGMQRMAGLRSLVRKLPAVETLGSVTVICSDKTGTLTRNEMTVCMVALDQREIAVTGTGYEPAGTFVDGGTAINVNSDESLKLILRIGCLCNDAKLDRSQDRTAILGDPTEAALIIAAEKAGLDCVNLARQFPRLQEVPFDSNRKRMDTIHRTPQGGYVAFVKGSPGTLLRASSDCIRRNGIKPLTSEERQEWEDANCQLAGLALRVLAFAYRELPQEYEQCDLTQGLTFVGLVGLHDPLRDEVKRSVGICREAGIRTIMITGDQPSTATEIARQMEIIVDTTGRSQHTIHGRDLEGLDEASWRSIVASAAVFARVSPEQKLRIVEALQAQGHIVAMTGDGVNDAPALKAADIGIAMGIKGTEVAKESADMVITDDNFASIVRAVEQGRCIYENIQRFLHYLLSCNFSEILTILFALLIGWPLPLAALQILWLNLVTDVFPAFALALEPSSPDSMRRPPRNPKESILTVPLLGLVLFQGFVLAAVTLAAFGIGLHWYGSQGEGHSRASTMAFMTLSLAQILHTFSARSRRRLTLTARLFTNAWLWAAVIACVALQIAAGYLPILSKLLKVVPPNTPDWIVILACALSPVICFELGKLVRHFRPDSNNRA